MILPTGKCLPVKLSDVTSQSDAVPEHPSRVNPSTTAPPEDPVLTSAKREALIVAGLWIGAMLYSVLFSWHYGYPTNLTEIRPEEIKLVWGIPFWVFWGVVVPWLACSLLSILIAYCLMKDQPLGEDVGDDESDLLN